MILSVGVNIDFRTGARAVLSRGKHVPDEWDCRRSSEGWICHVEIIGDFVGFGRLQVCLIGEKDRKGIICHKGLMVGGVVDQNG